jgi:hypothetical protein
VPFFFSAGVGLFAGTSQVAFALRRSLFVRKAKQVAAVFVWMLTMGGETPHPLCPAGGFL